MKESFGDLKIFVLFRIKKKKWHIGTFNLSTVISWRSTRNIREATKFMAGFNMSFHMKASDLFHKKYRGHQIFHPFLSIELD